MTEHEHTATTALRGIATECAAGAACAMIAGLVSVPDLGLRVCVAFAAAISGLALIRYLLAAHAARNFVRREAAPAWPMTIPLTLSTAGFVWGALAGRLVQLNGVDAVSGTALLSVLTLTFLVGVSYGGLVRIAAPYFVSSLGLPIVALLAIGQGASMAAAVLLLAGAGIAVLASMAAARRARELAAAEVHRDTLAAQLETRAREVSTLRLGIRTNSEERETLEATLKTKSADLETLSSQIEQLSKTLQRVTPLDEASGLLNAEHAHEHAAREWARMLRDEKPVCLVHVELDDIAAFRDTCGARAWETAMQRIGAVIARAGRRPGDCAGCVGEAKFMLILPGAGLKNGLEIAERVRKQIELLNISNVHSTDFGRVTGSVGLATMIPTAELSVGDLIGRADSALYEARFRGGNRVQQFRAMNTLRLERWDQRTEGEFSTAALIRKFSIWGYRPSRKVYRPGTYLPDRRTPVDTVDAVIEGEMRIILDGDTQILHRGDCLFVPKGMTTSAEVLSTESVVCLEGEKAA